MWNLPRPRIEPVSPALAGRFSSTPGKSQDSLRIEYFQFQVILFVFLFCYLMGTLFRVKSETESRLHLFVTLQAKRPGILQARILEWVAFPFSRGSSPTQGLNPGLLHCRQILYQLSYKGSPRALEWVAYPFSRGSSWSRNQTWVCRGLLYCRQILYLPAELLGLPICNSISS